MADCPLGSTKDTEHGTEVRSAKLVTAGADITPDAIDSALARAMVAEAETIGLPPGVGFWPVHEVMAYDPLARQLHADVVSSRNTHINRVPSRMDTKLRYGKKKILGNPDYKFSQDVGEEVDQIQIAVNALKKTSKEGKVGDWVLDPNELEPAIPISDKIVEFTKWYKDNVTAKVYEIRTGKHQNVDPILMEYKININDPKAYRAALNEVWKYHQLIKEDLTKRGLWQTKPHARRKLFQEVRDGKYDLWKNLQNDLPSSSRMQAVIQKTFGYIDRRVGSDFYVPFNDGAFGFLPVANEKANILHDLREIKTQIESGLMDKRKGDLYQKILVERLNRVNELELSTQNQAARQLPGQKILPRRHWTTSFLYKNPEGASYRFDTDFDLMHRRFVWSNMGARHLNEIYDRARMVLPQIKNQALNHYIMNWIDGIRGVKGYQEDAWIRWLAKKLTPWKVTETQIREWVTNIMKFQAITKLFLGPAYSLINGSQTVLTTMGLAGPEVVGRALARTLRTGNQAWREAKALGLLGEVGESILRESEAIGYSGVGRFMDRFMKKYPFAITARFSEDFNRVLAFNVGKLLSEADRTRLKPILKTLNLRGVKPGSKAEARAWGKAFMEATQFILSKEDRPTAFVGGAGRRLLGQFRSFGANYISLYANAWKHDKMSAFKMTAGLWFLAGLPGFPLYETMRNQIIKTTGHDLLPEWNGLSGIMERVGWGAWVPHSIDLTTRIEPFNLPRSLAARDLASTAFGPTLGPLFGLAEDITAEGASSPQAIKTMLRMVSPYLVSAGEAYSEYKRGGVFTPAGTLIGKQNLPQLIFRGIGMRPPMKQAYFQTRNKLKVALLSGNMDLVRQIAKDSRANGVIVTSKMVKRLQGEIKADKRKKAIDELEDIFFPRN